MSTSSIDGQRSFSRSSLFVYHTWFCVYVQEHAPGCTTPTQSGSFFFSHEISIPSPGRCLALCGISHIAPVNDSLKVPSWKGRRGRVSVSTCAGERSHKLRFRCTRIGGQGVRGEQPMKSDAVIARHPRLSHLFFLFCRSQGHLAS